MHTRKSSDDREKRIRMPDKGRNKTEKHKHQLLDMAATLPLDDDAFDDYLEYELDNFNRNKRR